MVFDPSTLDLGYDPGVVDLGAPLPTDGGAQPSSLLSGTDPLSTIINSIAGFGSGIQGLMNLLGSIVGDLETIIGQAERAGPLQWIAYLKDHASKVPVLMDTFTFFTSPSQTAAHQAGEALGGDAETIWNWVASIGGGAWYRALLEFGLGVHVDQFDDDALKGVNTTGTLIGFSVAIQYAVALIEFLGKGLFATRWGEPLKESISKIPEEMGLSWALGLAIDEGYKTAVGRSIEEAINRQKRGNRIEWPVLRTMLRQHIFADLTTDGAGHVTGTVKEKADYPGIDVLEDLLKNEGFPDWQISMLMGLADQELPVGDLQQMYLHEIMTADEVGTYLERLGFSKGDASKLKELYITKAETAAGSIYRSTARSLFVSQLITEDMYREILTHSNFPSREIEDDIAAINLEHSVGRIAGTVSAVKAQLQHGTIDVQTALKELRLLNYSEDAATQLINTWQLPPLHKRHGLSQAKILGYYKANVLTYDQALARLIDTNLNIDDAHFILDHPDAASGVKVRKRTPGLVTEAVIAGALGVDDAPAAYKIAGVADEDIPLYMANLRYKVVNTKGTNLYTATLTQQQILDAFRYGIILHDDAMQRLLLMGYSSDDAEVLIEIANKGPIVPGAMPLFTTLDDAIAYLFSVGITVYPPPDPRLAAAEAFVAGQGYSFSGVGESGGGGGGSGGGSGTGTNILTLAGTLHTLSLLGYLVEPNPTVPGGYIINPPPGPAG